MKSVERLYDRLTPVERFQIAVAAFGRGDLTEVDRLNDATPYRQVKIQEPAYFDRLQRIVWLALHFMVDARNLQITALAGFLAMVIHLLGPTPVRTRVTQPNPTRSSTLWRSFASRELHA